MKPHFSFQAISRLFFAFMRCLTSGASVSPDVLPIGVVRFDAGCGLIYANTVFRLAHNLADVPAVPVSLAACYVRPAVRAIIHDEALPSVLKTGFWDGELEDVHPNGERRVYKLSLKRLGDGSIVGCEHDVSAAKKAQADADELARIYAQSLKFDALGKLTGGVAHDFNNMLAVVSGNLDLIEDELPEDGKGRQFVRSAQRAVARGADLTYRLLGFSRRQVLTPEMLDVRAFVNDFVPYIPAVSENVVRVDTQVSSDAGAIFADKAQLEKALNALVANACEAMPQGGRITLCVTKEHLEGPVCLSRNVAAGDYVVFALSDTGCGIPPDVLGHVCEPFFTTKEAGLSVGLGLSTVYGFMRQSGGFLDVSSTLKVGTTVRAFFPAARQSGQGKEGYAA